MKVTVASAELPADEQIKIQKNRLEPLDGRKGKRISIVTGIHGDELEGQFVCYEILHRIKSHMDQLHGTVDVYPAINPMGIDNVERGLPDFDLDMNRIFPGNPDGTMYESLASSVIQDIEGSDLVIDIHASNIFLTAVPQIRINELHGDQLLPYASRLNCDFIWVHSNATVLESTLAYSMNSRGVPTLVVEMGVGMRITREFGLQLTDGILHVMQYLGIWSGSVGKCKKPIISRDPDEVVFLNAPDSGIFMKNVNAGSFVRRGDLIGTLIDPLEGTKTADIRASEDGWLFTIREYPVVQEGSLMGRILRGGHSAER